MQGHYAKRMITDFVIKVKANDMFHEENKLQKFLTCCGLSHIK